MFFTSQSLPLKPKNMHLKYHVIVFCSIFSFIFCSCISFGYQFKTITCAPLYTCVWTQCSHHGPLGQSGFYSLASNLFIFLAWKLCFYTRNWHFHHHIHRAPQLYLFCLERFPQSTVPSNFFGSRNFSLSIFGYTLNYSFYSSHLVSFLRVPIIHSFIFYLPNL